MSIIATINHDQSNGVLQPNITATNGTNTLTRTLGNKSAHQDKSSADSGALLTFPFNPYNPPENYLGFALQAATAKSASVTNGATTIGLTAITPTSIIYATAGDSPTFVVTIDTEGKTQALQLGQENISFMAAKPYKDKEIYRIVDCPYISFGQLVTQLPPIQPNNPYNYFAVPLNYPALNLSSKAQAFAITASDGMFADIPLYEMLEFYQEYLQIPPKVIEYFKTDYNSFEAANAALSEFYLDPEIRQKIIQAKQLYQQGFLANNIQKLLDQAFEIGTPEFAIALAKATQCSDDNTIIISPISLYAPSNSVTIHVVGDGVGSQEDAGVEAARVSVGSILNSVIEFAGIRRAEHAPLIPFNPRVKGIYVVKSFKNEDDVPVLSYQIRINGLPENLKNIIKNAVAAFVAKENDECAITSAANNYEIRVLIDPSKPELAIKFEKFVNTNLAGIAEAFWIKDNKIEPVKPTTQPLRG